MAEAGLLLAAVVVPLLALPRAGRGGPVLLAAPAIPALAAALVVPSGTSVALPWLLLGGSLGLDDTGRTFLLLAALLWGTAGLHAGASVVERRGRFQAAWLVVMAGNFLVTVTTDPVLYLAGFAAVGLVGYVLVVHAGTAEARRAANRYLALVALGEALVFAGMVGTVALDGLPANWAVAALVAGFGIKAALVPLHVWLPLAHPVAPTPASAVLSGTLIKVGLLGWLRFLPLGEAAFPKLGAALVVLGLAGAFLAAVVGIPQMRAKVVLAYSSVSQMGWLVLAVGLGLMAPQRWAALEPAVVLFALHHGLAKGALFLAAGSAPRVAQGGARLLAGVGLVLPAAALMGLPLTSGGAAKEALKGAAYGIADLPVGLWLAWGSAATTLLTARAVYLAWPQGGGSGLKPAEACGWGGAVLAGGMAAWAWPPLHEAGRHLLASGHAPASAAPIAAALVVAVLGGGLLAGRGLGRALALPPGDLLVALEGVARWTAARGSPALPRWGGWWVPANRLWFGLKGWLWDPWRYRVFAADRWGWLGSGTAFLAVAVALLLVLVNGD